MGILNKVTDFFVGGIKSFVTKPSLPTAGAAALDVVSLTPLGKVASIGGKVISKVAKGAINVAKALIPSTTKGKVIATGASLIGYGFVKESPELAKQAITETPNALINIGENLGKVGEAIKDKDLPAAGEAAKETIKENPLLVGLGAFGVGALITRAIGLGALLVGQKVFSQDGKQVRLTNATEEQLLKLIAEKEKENQPQVPITPQLPPAPQVPITPQLPTNTPTAPETPKTLPVTSTPAASSSPVLPATQTISTTTRRRRRSPVKSPQRQIISQRVNVLINSGKFINKRSRSY